MATLDECYAVLGVTPYSPKADVSAKYRLLIQVWHPDRFESQKGIRDQAEEQLKRITAAYKQVEAAGFPVRAGAPAPAPRSNAPAPVRAPAPCPYCGVANRLPSDYEDQVVTCGGCRAAFRVDGAGQAVKVHGAGRQDMTPSHVKCPTCGASNWCVPEEMVACVKCGAFFSWG